MLVGIATSADSPPQLRGKVVELDRFSAQVALETREPALRQGASVWLHFDPPGGGSPLSVGGIISGVARGGRITVLLSLSPREYSRLRGLPEPEVQRGRRAAQPSSLTLPGIKPIQKREAPEPRPDPATPRPAQPAEAPSPGSAVEPDVASLSPIERARAMAAALAELVGPSVEPAPPRPVEPAEAPGKVEAQPTPASPPPVERAEPPAEMVVPQPEPVSASPVEPAEAPAVIEPSGEPAWLRPAEEALAPVEPVEPPPELVSVSPVAPVEMVAPEPEPVSASPVEPVEAPPAIEPGSEPEWLRSTEEAEAPVEVVEPAPEPAGMSPPESVEAPAEVVEPAPEPVIHSPIEPLEAPPPATKPSDVRPGLFSRLAAALGMTGPRAEPASPRPVEPAEAPVEMVEPTSEPVGPVPMEPAEAPAAIEAGGEPAWLQPAEEAEAPVELVESPPVPASVSPREQAEALIGRGDLQGAWKVYYDALRVEPDDLRLWHGLGLTLSRLDRRKEAEEIFRYVVSRGDPDSEEMKHALHWLVSAAAADKAAAPAKAVAPAKAAARAVPSTPPRETERWASVRGKVTWGKPEPPREAFLVVQGLDKDGPRAHARVPFGQSYQFDRLLPGAYHLIGGAETEWLWDLRFTVEAGQELILDLTRDNSTNPTARV